MDGIEVRRYRYAPAALETLVNDGGIVTNLRRAPWKWLLLPGFMIGLLWSAWRAIVHDRPAVAHVHWLLPQGLALATIGLLDRRVPPFLATSHGADLFALRAPALQLLKRFVARRAGGLTVVSAAMRAEMARIGIDVSRVEVEPMGVDLTTRYTPDPAIQRSRHELLFVGRLVEKKGLKHLIDAMPQILQAHPSAFLTVAGFGPEEAERRQQVGRLGLDDKVRFLGAVPQAGLPSLYRRAAVFVAPFVEAVSGDREGLGLVVVEAAGCGCPLVVSDLPAVHQIFPDRAGAVLVAPGDARALASAVQSVLDEPARHPAPGREQLRAAFDWRSRADRYAALLTAIAR
jgi:glycosyltransferase involved in cell wall biosynthesis